MSWRLWICSRRSASSWASVRLCDVLCPRLVRSVSRGALLGCRGGHVRVERWWAWGYVGRGHRSHRAPRAAYVHSVPTAPAPSCVGRGVHVHVDHSAAREGGHELGRITCGGGPRTHMRDRTSSA
jgi:hypothetical protein